MAKNRTCGSAQERPTQDRACESSALPNYDELEMDSSAPRNGIMDARLQPSSPINPCFVSKVRGQVTGDGRQVSDSGLASASRRELVNEKG